MRLLPRVLVAAVVVVCLHTPAYAAITPGDVSDAAVISGAGTSGSALNFTIASGDTAVCGLAIDTASTDNAPTATWDMDGANQTLGSPDYEHEGTGRAFYIWIATGLTPATNDAVLFDNLTASGEKGGCFALAGVDQVTPFDAGIAVTSGTITTCTTGTVTSPSGDWIVSIISLDGAETLTAGGGGNTIDIQSSGTLIVFGIGHDADGADDTFDWAWDASSNSGACGGININAAAAGGSHVTDRLRIRQR